MNVTEFGQQLATAIGRPTELRPFVCEGSPLDCEVFIVGYNPATTMDGDWWRFWKQGYGFQKSLWRKEYLAQRGEESKTRAKIEDIVGSLIGVRVLEANIDARPSERKSAYPRPVTKPFDYVLSACHPKVVIAHGTDAVEHLQSWKSKGALICCKHFIYVGHERTSEILEETRHALANSSAGTKIAALSSPPNDTHDAPMSASGALLADMPLSPLKDGSEGAVISFVGKSAALREAARGLDAILKDIPALSLKVGSSQVSIWFFGKRSVRLFRLKRDGIKADLLIHLGFVDKCPDLKKKFHIASHKNPDFYRFASDDPTEIRHLISLLRSVIQSYQ